MSAGALSQRQTKEINNHRQDLLATCPSVCNAQSCRCTASPSIAGTSGKGKDKALVAGTTFCGPSPPGFTLGRHASRILVNTGARTTGERVSYGERDVIRRAVSSRLSWFAGQAETFWIDCKGAVQIVG